MARTVERILREQIGALVLENARLTSELEAALEKVAALEKPNGTKEPQP